MGMFVGMNAVIVGMMNNVWEDCLYTSGKKSGRMSGDVVNSI